MSQPRYLSHFAGSSGNGDGIEMVAAHSSETDYYITPPLGEVWEIARAIFSWVDVKSFEIEEFGAQTALVGGISLVVSRLVDGVAVEETLNPGHPIKDNGDFGHLCYDVQWLKWANSTNEQAVARWTFSKGGAPIVLRYGEKLIVRFLANSDTSALIEIHTCFQGVNLAYAD